MDLIHKTVTVFTNDRILILLLFFLTNTVYGQETSAGIYLTLECTHEMTREPVMGRSKKFVCLTKQPIITYREFESISELQQLPTLNYVFFDLQLSEKGFRTLRKVASSINSELALVVDNRVVFVVDPKETEVYRSFSIGGDAKEKNVYLVHEKLKLIMQK